MNSHANQKLIKNWKQIRLLFRRSFFSSLHYTIASVNSNGTPHVTPIGSLILDQHEPKGFYFEIFTTNLRKNIEVNPNICILAVNSGLWFWLSSLLRGKFQTAPAIRLYGTAGARRPAEVEDTRRWRKRIGLLQGLKGYRLLWGNLTYVREVQFHNLEVVNMGKMTQSLRYL